MVPRPVLSKEAGGCRLTILKDPGLPGSNSSFVAVFSVWPDGVLPVEVRFEWVNNGEELHAQLGVLIIKAERDSSTHIRKLVPLLKSMVAEIQAEGASA